MENPGSGFLKSIPYMQNVALRSSPKKVCEAKRLTPGISPALHNSLNPDILIKDKLNIELLERENSIITIIKSVNRI
ncbi:hypothetical protein HMPREF0496_1887 [Lentilactobacillus hilgardii ATCC 27305]|nr:hypothetical protein HMPREF0496_1887 [Lentilactobacillus hilgardii ATCC 27305]